jgi:hypothetical protein
MDIKVKSALVSAVRRYSSRWKPKYEAKKERKVGEATFRCDDCGIFCYEGTKPLSKLTYPKNQKVIAEKIQADHRLSCVPPEGFKTGILVTGGKRIKDYLFDWNIFLTRMFCKREDYQFLCKTCHKQKTDIERETRKK